MLICLIAAALFTNTFFERLSADWMEAIGFAPNDLWYWRLERMITSAVVTSGAQVFWEALICVALFVGMAERLCGWKRTAIVFWGVHLITLVLLSLIITLGAAAFPSAGLDAVTLARDVGPSAGYFACLGLVSSRLKPPWQWVSGGILLLVFVIAFLLPPDEAETAALNFSTNSAHLLAFPLGWLFGGFHLPSRRSKTVIGREVRE